VEKTTISPSPLLPEPASSLIRDGHIHRRCHVCRLWIDEKKKIEKRKKRKEKKNGKEKSGFVVVVACLLAVDCGVL
jgi:hypothetical protein